MLCYHLEVKRELVKNSAAWHRRKGTASVIEEVVKAAFDDAVVSEWYEYGGAPYHFRVTTRKVVSDPNKLIELAKIINSVKRNSAWLEALEIARDTTQSIYVGSVIHTRRKITIYQEGVS
ncbi:phage tail protein [Chengkuizengella axinellae]|uniref:Phage tail protein n=1 Tax=Chengkuizengella axinellae TaxID=3064388 RepID=A0ABT9J4V4_9BACL|nr:phage tail protein [Chengkuizengella sp. 2205SS18-9]MDP5276636.1 phage tail protein [Chengkuizengella sp. 2205SS18-9]